MIEKISFHSYGTESCSAMSGGLYPCFGSVGNQRKSAEKTIWRQSVSRSIYIDRTSVKIAVNFFMEHKRSKGLRNLHCYHDN